MKKIRNIGICHLYISKIGFSYLFSCYAICEHLENALLITIEYHVDSTGVVLKVCIVFFSVLFRNLVAPGFTDKDVMIWTKFRTTVALYSNWRVTVLWCFFAASLNKLLKGQSSCYSFNMSWRSCDITSLKLLKMYFFLVFTKFIVT